VPFVEKVTFASDATFDTDKAELKAPARARLDELVDKLQGADLTAIHVVGYTDAIGSDSYNDKLSERRAIAVRDYLVGKGLNPSQIDTAGHGKRDPVASNATKEGRAQNRRVEVEVDGSRTTVR
jgi:OOP family OmpA-OmpF porin